MLRKSLLAFWVIVFLINTVLLVPIFKAEACHMFVVSFISIGTGINQNAQQDFDSFLKSEYPTISYEKIPRGREGELDYCFKLSDLSPTRRANFIEGSKRILTKVNLVKISENSNCRTD
ncbi:MAG: hypothetical protein AB4038_02955 [Prochloraceae cyanobacterium]